MKENDVKGTCGGTSLDFKIKEMKTFDSKTDGTKILDTKFYTVWKFYSKMSLDEKVFISKWEALLNFFFISKSDGLFFLVRNLTRRVFFQHKIWNIVKILLQSHVL